MISSREATSSSPAPATARASRGRWPHGPPDAQATLCDWGVWLSWEVTNRNGIIIYYNLIFNGMFHDNIHMFNNKIDDFLGFDGMYIMNYNRTDMYVDRL